MKNIVTVSFLTLLSFSMNGCKKVGCADPLANNYNSEIKEKNDDGICSYTSRLNIYLSQNFQTNWKNSGVKIIKMYVAGAQIFNDSIDILPNFDNQLCDSANVSYIKNSNRERQFKVLIRVEGFDDDQKLLFTKLGSEQITAGSCQDLTMEL